MSDPQAGRVVRNLEQFIRVCAGNEIEAEYDAMVEQITRLTAERDALFKTYSKLAVDYVDDRRKSRLQGIREGLEWAVTTADRYFEVRTSGALAALRTGNPEQIAAEVDALEADDAEQAGEPQRGGT